MVTRVVGYCGFCGQPLRGTFCPACAVFTETRRLRRAHRVLLAFGAVILAVLIAAVALLARVRSVAATEAYDARFYADAHDTVGKSAAVVVPYVHDLIKPASVVDIGCGVGEWLAEFKKLGVKNVHGVDGPWVARDQLMIDPSEFESVDLEHASPKARRADLAISLEVGEHLKKETGPKLVLALSATAPVVLFSAAVPGQGGTSHINEQWPSYWHKLFEARGYAVVDAIRPRFQHDARVAFYYRQNIVLYVSQQHLPRLGLTAKSFDNPNGIDWVHVSRRKSRLAAMGLRWLSPSR